ncbi:leucine-rich repeat domain-containing protein [Algoriphagus vanfongensis]|uniref:leucine-rich repeat domain-containing protein n=1 Tax=Algoriphagus vanfongensis TaxID=426371 RepID=UPI000416B72D|nr:leucine-rich repeat domain-containing protein [Algoriphagus vanfongensis]
MIRSKRHFLLLLIIFLAGPIAYSQSIKGYTKEEIKDFSSKVEDQVRFLEYLLNTVGSSQTSARDKDVIIRESYLKIFRDAEVQVEDDLLLDRKVVTNKDVTAYMKDIEFFFQDVNFKFKVREVKPAQKDNGEVYFMVSLDRTLDATGKDGKKVTNTKPRFVEVNLLEKSQELKIVSMYTTKLSRDEELLEWWEILNPHWKAYFQQRFDVSPYDSVDVEQLYRFVSIDSLDISGTDSLLDLSPLQALRELKFVDLSNTQITALGPISNVTFLQYLDVSNTPTSDIQFIKYSDRLKELNISNTQIQDISELRNLKSLMSLKAEKTPIMSFAVLNEFDSLRSLELAESGFNNAENIKELNRLERLDLSRNYLINFTSLGELESLRYLNLSQTNIQDLTPLNKLENLEIVDLTQTEIADISVLNAKPNLEKVLADQTGLSVSAADNFIRNNPDVLLIHHVKDLESWWAGLSDPWKESLKKANSQIRNDQPNVEVLTTTIGLEKLDLSNSGIETLNPLTRFAKLKSVDFSGNPISDLLPLSEVKTLEQITGIDTEVRDLSAIRNNEALQKVNFEGSPIESILPVLSLPNLAYLNVDSSAIFAEEVPEVLIKKPELTLIYRTEALQLWWNELPTNWKEVFRREFKMPEEPSTEQLHDLTGKSTMELNRVSVQDIRPLTVFANLRSLKVFDAPIQDISPISELSLLTSLQLSQAPISDFLPVSSLFKLETLDISNTGIEDLQPLASLTDLRVLNISGTNLRVLKGLEGLHNLKELDVASTNLRSLRPIEGLSGLEKLSCFNTRLSSRTVDRFKETNPDCEVRYY